MTTAATSAPTATSLDEFSDRLSPMLVKELRQGLRAKTFVILFLTLQALLGVVLLTAVGATSSSGDSGRTVSSIIFFFFSLAALVAQPLRGVGALHNEIKGQTIDLMVLTRLGAWRIVLGKWVAIVSQTALLLITIFPYLILRYFFGRMDLFAELNLLLLIFLGSAVFTAITVGLSALPSIIIRGLVPLFLAIYLGGGIMGLTFGREIDDVIKFCSLREDGTGWALLIGALFGGYFGWFSLGLGASIIAPMAENHSTVRRIVVICLLLIMGLIVHLADLPRAAAGAFLALIATPALVIALTEPFQLLPPMTRPFLKMKMAGKLAGRAFYPGWPTGVIFSGLIIALCAAIFLSVPARGSRSMYSVEPALLVMLLSGTCMLILSGLVLRILGDRIKKPMGVYILVFVALLGIGIGLALIAAETKNDEYLWLFSWIPSSYPALIDLIQKEHYSSKSFTTTGSPDYTTLITIGVASCIGYYLALFIIALRKFSAIRDVENEALDQPQTES